MNDDKVLQTIKLEDWKPNHPKGTLYAYAGGQIIARYPDGTEDTFNLEETK